MKKHLEAAMWEQKTSPTTIQKNDHSVSVDRILTNE